METPSRLGPPQAQTPPRSLEPADAAGAAGSTPAQPSSALQLRPRPSWTFAIEDVSQTIRNSISSWASAHLPLADPALVSSKEDDHELRHLPGLMGDADLESGQRRHNGHGNDNDDDDGGGVVIDLESLIPPPEFTPIPRPLTLMTLPIEIQLNIMRHMTFGDIERLRRTGRHYHRLASQPILRATIGSAALRSMLLSHCRVCLKMDASRETLLAAEMGRDYPFSAKCVDCALNTRDSRLSRRTIGDKVILGNYAKVWACRWCARPVVTGAARHHAQFHPRCYTYYMRALILFFLVGVLQFAIGNVAAALAWKYLRGDLVVFPASVASYILMWFCLLIVMFRSNDSRTYGIGLVTELTILGLWIPQLYFTVQRWANTDPSGVPAGIRAAAVFFALNALFRLLNVLGNLPLWAEYDRSSHHLPKVPMWRRKLVNPLIDLLIFWTYPQSVEQKYKKPPTLLSKIRGSLSHKLSWRRDL